MSHGTGNPWNQPTLRSFGNQIRALVKEAERQSQPPRRTGLTRVLLASGTLVLVAIVAVLVFRSGRTAQARNVINEAPAAAEHAGSLRFHSTLTVEIDGHTRSLTSEEGAIDFLTGEYTATVENPTTRQRVQTRRVGRLLYVARQPTTVSSGQPTRWVSAPVRAGMPGGFAVDSDAFTDPPTIFRTLAHISAPVRRIGPRYIDVQTTLYRLSTNLTAFLRPATGRIEHIQAYRSVAATLNVWIDKSHRPRRVEETFSAHGTIVRTIAHFSGYGEAVTVQAPPPQLTQATHGNVGSNPFGTRPGPLIAALIFFKPAPVHSP